MGWLKVFPSIVVQGETLVLKRTVLWVEYNGPTICIFRSEMSRKWYGISRYPRQAYTGSCDSLEEAIARLEWSLSWWRRARRFLRWLGV